ncbi:MAG TPA: HD domain-containing phosphohydrolase [Anaerolineales bacterium]|nr:HD domain-containing phosphohydrolase [Anaerolineales bacterium]HLO33748.1 HD domain-containing phosphohydrolase [Anaerolineales bacterium]
MNKILIVDDQEQNLYLLKSLLMGHGYQVVEATNGAEALELSRSAPPDLVITDILMPVMDGFSLCHEWTNDESLKNIPFVFYTATYTDPKDQELALNLGAARFIVKPIETEEFISILEQVLAEAESGLLAASQKSVSEETSYYRMYNEALIRKLEDKTLQLKMANRALEEDLTDREQMAKALSASEAELRALFASMNDVVLVIDRNGVYREIAPTNPGLLYRPREELLGKTLQDVFPVEQAESFISTIRQVVETQETTHIEYQLDINGRTVWFDTSISPIDVENTLWVARDITDRKQAEIEIRRLLEESQQRLKQVEALHTIDIAISASMDLRTTLNVLLKHVETLLSVDASDILLFSPELQGFRFSAERGFRTASIEHASVHPGASFAGRAALQRKTVFVSGELAPQADRDFSKMYEKEGFFAYAGVPLIAKGQIKGVLEVYHRTAHQPETEWLNLLETLAGQAAIAIDNAQLFTSLQQSNTELALAYDATIAGWSRAMDLRDKETEGHTQRVTELSLKLARSMMVKESQLRHIRHGALLHDIGKMGVPDNILLKADELTDEEWEKMRKHPVFAYEMLSSIRYLQPALDIPYCHHEKWDGTGYPRGLKGEEIPIAARIFAVADVWDAITSDRPYRKGWAKEDALGYIKEQSGKYFDPQVVEEFLKLISEDRKQI